MSDFKRIIRDTKARGRNISMQNHPFIHVIPVFHRCHHLRDVLAVRPLSSLSVPPSLLIKPLTREIGKSNILT